MSHWTPPFNDLGPNERSLKRMVRLYQAIALSD